VEGQNGVSFLSTKPKVAKLLTSRLSEVKEITFIISPKIKISKDSKQFPILITFNHLEQLGMRKSNDYLIFFITSLCEGELVVPLGLTYSTRIKFIRFIYSKLI